MLLNLFKTTRYAVVDLRVSFVPSTYAYLPVDRRPQFLKFPFVKVEHRPYGDYEQSTSLLSGGTAAAYALYSRVFRRRLQGQGPTGRARTRRARQTRGHAAACCTLSATSGHPATVGVKPEVHFTEGQDVTEGQLLITLTPDPLRLFCAKNAACWPNLKRS
ncbi:hypothetical protein AGMMS50248_07900 [Deltaproteobacteria bacterium]|nr:hypothetical protein AGMMS50248_07900 [Deltaproteobacteria bacterium]